MVSMAYTGMIPTANPGDRIIREKQTLEEKAQQIAVDKYDITGAHVKIPTYFIVQYPNGESKALHHVRDAQQISDVIRQMHLEEEDWHASTTEGHSLQANGFMVVLGLFMFALFLLTATISIGIF